MSDLVLVFNIRGSDRLSTDNGRQLTKIVSGFPEFAKWIVSERLRLGRASPSLCLRSELIQAQVLPVLCGSIDQCLGSIELGLDLGNSGPIFVLDGLQGISGAFQVRQASLVLSHASDMSGVEGDEATICIACQEIYNSQEHCDAAILRESFPPRGSAEAIRWVGLLSSGSLSCLGEKFVRLAVDAPMLHRAGFYAVDLGGLRSSGNDDFNKKSGAMLSEWRTFSFARVTLLIIVAYIFRCYLCAQRLERQLLAFEPAGDWDTESRRLLHARGRHLVFSRLALLKNRATLGAPVLVYYESILVQFRLRTLSSDLGALLINSGDVLGGRNAYLDSARLRTIEAVLFVASMLSLAIALNAIQMPPFFDAQTKNALTREEFWIVIVVTMAFFMGLWGTVNGWRLTRRFLRWVFGRIRLG